MLKFSIFSLLPEHNTVSFEVIIIILSDNHDTRILECSSFNRDFYSVIGIPNRTQELANLDYIDKI